MTKRGAALLAVWVAPSALLLLLARLVAGNYHIPVPERLGPDARARALDVLRGALDGTAEEPTHQALDVSLDGGPVVVTAWLRGKRAARVVGAGARLGEAVGSAARALAASPVAKETESERRQVRLQVDVIGGRAPLLVDVPGLDLFALHPGLDGIGVTTPSGEQVLLPDDMARQGMLRSRRPVTFVPDLNVGYDLEKVDAALAQAAGVAFKAWKAIDRSYFRFRTYSFIEPHIDATDRAPLELTRGLPSGPPVTPENLRAAGVSGARYLVAHLAENGRYIYETDLTTGKSTNPKRLRPYSLPRHAGTTYFLAELYRLTKEEFLREPIERAFEHFAGLVAEGGCTGRTPGGADFACVHEEPDKWATLGSTALAVVALCEYRRATEDGRYDELARKLAEWILMLQREDGSFAHRYDVKGQVIDHDTQVLYFSGEAALAMARMHAVYGDPRYLDATERALDDLIAWYDFFAGGFFFGEDHWTCIAAEAVWPALKHERYRAFCDAYGEFLRRQQVRDDDFASQADLAGTYGVTPFIIPNNTPVGSRTEAMLSSYLLGVYHERPSEPLRQQILRSMEYALRQQVRPDSAFAVAPEADGIGAITGSSIDRRVRIDYVQHVCSAMVRTIPLLESAR